MAVHSLSVLLLVRPRPYSSQSTVNIDWLGCFLWSPDKQFYSQNTHGQLTLLAQWPLPWPHWEEEGLGEQVSFRDSSPPPPPILLEATTRWRLWLGAAQSLGQEGSQPGADLPGSALGRIGSWKGEPPLWKIFQKRDRLGLIFENVYQDYMEKNVEDKEKQVHLLHWEPLTVSWKARSLLISLCVGAGGVVLGPLSEKSHEHTTFWEVQRWRDWLVSFSPKDRSPKTLASIT